MGKLLRIAMSVSLLLVFGCAHKEPKMPPLDRETQATIDTPEAKAYLSVLEQNSQRSKVAGLDGVPVRVAAEAASRILSSGKNPYIVIFRVSDTGALLSYIVDREGGSDFVCDYKGKDPKNYIVREMRTVRIGETRKSTKKQVGQIAIQSMVRFNAIRSDLSERSSEHEKVSILSRDRIRDVVSTIVEKSLKESDAVYLCDAKGNPSGALNEAVVKASVVHYKCLSALLRYKTILESVGKEPDPADVKKSIPECTVDDSYTVPEGPKNY